MADPSVHSLAIAQIVIYAPLSLLTLFIAIRNLKHLSILGWGYLFVFETLQLVGAGLQLGNDSKNKNGPGIVSAIGLSALLLAALGILHEA